MRLQIYKIVFGLLLVLLATASARAEDFACYSFETVNNVKLVYSKKIQNNRPGLTSRPYRLKVKAIPKKCGSFKQIVWTNDITIYLFHKLGECQHREVFNHEKKHVGSYLKAFKAIPPWVDTYMKAQGKGASNKQIYQDIYARLLTMQKKITKMNRAFDWDQYKNPKVIHYVIRACGSVWGK